MKHRPERVNKLIQEKLGEIISREIEFPNALVTVSRVETDKKLAFAEVFFTVFPPGATEQASRILGSAQARLQYMLAGKINIKPMPKIRFKLDTGAENSAAIEKIVINKLDFNE